MEEREAVAGDISHLRNREAHVQRAWLCVDRERRIFMDERRLKMKVEQVVEVKTTLVLTENEREWLHDYMCNSFTEDESHLDAGMRKAFFDATERGPR